MRRLLLQRDQDQDGTQVCQRPRPGRDADLAETRTGRLSSRDQDGTQVFQRPGPGRDAGPPETRTRTGRRSSRDHGLGRELSSSLPAATRHRAGKMVGHQWLPWINNPTSTSATSAKQDQEIPSDCFAGRKKVTCHQSCPVVGLSALCLLLLVACVALSVLYKNASNSKPEWRSLLFDYQNVSDGYLALTAANDGLRRDKQRLEEHSDWLREQAELLNGTSANLMSVNLALSLESGELMEQIVNLTSTNLRLAREHERLVRLASEQEAEKLNASQAIKRLVDADARRDEEGRRLSQINNLLRDELVQVKENNRKLLELNDESRGEVKTLSERMGAASDDDGERRRRERLTELQEQNQNLSLVLEKERREVVVREESRRGEMDRMAADVRSMKEAFSSLDLYCPEVDHRTKERICRTCPDSWRLFESKCYFFSSRVLTWSSSRSWCRTQGGDLLVINSGPEQSFVFEGSQSGEASGSRLWIGLTDAEEEGGWSWVDGSPVASDVQYWLSRPGLGAEPDDWKLDDPLGEDCGHIDISENALMSWMDGSCKTPYRWICEKNI